MLDLPHNFDDEDLVEELDEDYDLVEALGEDYEENSRHPTRNDVADRVEGVDA
ncbi:hypothetical protein H0H81_010555 [Sphagnurus paluster]|uniref:Uncharacterized protein n=1 Tax=Sphagnurus paluster TaxID=117069 RepID=A0A9P7K7C3_9AGAR|nr:hypothetical protein H0H81_010555 [Sphagnurus paluster]